MKVSLYSLLRFLVTASSSSPNLAPSLVSDCSLWPSCSLRAWNTSAEGGGNGDEEGWGTGGGDGRYIVKAAERLRERRREV